MVEYGPVPPNQRVTQKWPVLHYGVVPTVDLEQWDFRVYGFVERPLRFDWTEFLQLPKVTRLSDFHCVTGWSRLQNRWEGMAFKALMDMARPKPDARFVTIEAEQGYTTSLSISELMEDDVLLAYRWEGEPLTPEHGGPLRLIVPKKYAYKSAKWVRAIRLTEAKELGFWESRGYSDKADPWKEQRYSWDDEDG